jgi:hypothetical protein
MTCIYKNEVYMKTIPQKVTYTLSGENTFKIPCVGFTIGVSWLKCMYATCERETGNAICFDVNNFAMAVNIGAVKSTKCL